MINVEEALAVQDKKLADLYEQGNDLRGRINKLEELLYQAFPSSAPPSSGIAIGYSGKADSTWIGGSARQEQR